MVRIIGIIFFGVCNFQLLASGNFNNPPDSILGALTPARDSWEVSGYVLNLRYDTVTGAISGSNKIIYHRLKNTPFWQIDLAPQFTVKSVTDQFNKPLSWSRKDATILFPEITDSDTGSFIVSYSGIPREAPLAPWEGGFVRRRDPYHNDPWITVACQGLGASSWFPLKDHLSDEPDSVRIFITVPVTLQAICNGKLISKRPAKPGEHTFEYFISCPINTYNITLNIGNYEQHTKTLSGISGDLTADFYVLKNTPDTAIDYLREESQKMITAMEYYFGAYPCYADGFGLIETPYWGMEHQGLIAYGNRGNRLPEGFDFIIVHESGHEWWGNSVSVKDAAELWIHEGFTTYSEALYLEYWQGYEKSIHYLQKQKLNIENSSPLLGPMNINYDGWKDSDIYFKGTWFLHTLRNHLHNDSVWFSGLKYIPTHYHYQSFSTAELLAYWEKSWNQKLAPLFEQYLEKTKIPILKITRKGEGKWKHTVPGFDLNLNLPSFGKIHNSGEYTLKGNLKMLKNLSKQEWKGLERYYLSKVKGGKNRGTKAHPKP
ncbi:MAG: M1 family peptidase [Sphingobacteriia bacterium]|nr:M1 family peptidase [Sphingobacteriia bacterium]